METMIMNYYRKIDRTKIQFDFLIFIKDKCFYEDEINELGGKIYRINVSRRESFLGNHKEVKNFFKNHEYKVVEFHQGITYYYPLKMAKKYGVKCRIIHNHGIDRNYLKRLKYYNNLFAKKRICNLANMFFSCSEDVNNQLFSNKIIKNNLIEIIPNAIDTKSFLFSEEKRKNMRQYLKISDNTTLYAHIGTFTYPKNHKFLLRIYEEILKKDNNSKLLLIGKGPLEDEIKDEIKNRKLEKNVVCLGTRNDIPELLSAIDIFIFPSIFEGIPLTLVEAQASGLPVIASDAVSSKVIVINNYQSISLEKSAKDWCEIVLNTKILNKERYNYNAIVCKTQYNIENCVKNITNIYNSCTKEKRKE